MEERKCENCWYCEVWKCKVFNGLDMKQAEDAYSCRFNPPTVGGEVYVKKNQWCGKFYPKTMTPMMDMEKTINKLKERLGKHEMPCGDDIFRGPSPFDSSRQITIKPCRKMPKDMVSQFDPDCDGCKERLW